jgi:hypothetical protein
MAGRGECGKTCSTTIGVFASLALLVSGCGLKTEADYPNQIQNRPGDVVYDSEFGAKPDVSIFGDGGLDLFDLGGNRKNSQGGPGIAVNSFLWRASLDTIAFLPLSSADPFGGVIITDWYSPPEAPGERYKMSVYILGRQLRADGVRVAVFRQQIKGGDGWRTTSVSKDTATSLENQILSRARQLRIASANNR